MWLEQNGKEHRLAVRLFSLIAWPVCLGEAILVMVALVYQKVNID